MCMDVDILFLLKLQFAYITICKPHLLVSNVKLCVLWSKSA
jgi:hypothetical protein